MDGQDEPKAWGEEPGAGRGKADFADRLAQLPASRLRDSLGPLVTALQELIRDLAVTPDEFGAVLEYLTEVGHYSDARRQEWVLLADALGLSALVEDLSNRRPAGATPNTVAGPFYRADAPDRAYGATTSLDGKGVPLSVRGTVTNLDKEPIGGALVEVWQANGQGKYENQEPDHQPENNLRGRFATDDQGRFAFTSVMPGGYALPSDGPVGRLMTALGLCLERPAHLHFRVTAAGYERLTTQIFDRADPAIGRDAVFAVRPELLADFAAIPLPGGQGGRQLDLTLVLCPARQG